MEYLTPNSMQADSSEYGFGHCAPYDDDYQYSGDWVVEPFFTDDYPTRVMVAYWEQPDDDEDGPCSCLADPHFTLTYMLGKSVQGWNHFVASEKDHVNPNSTSNMKWTQGILQIRQYTTINGTGEPDGQNRFGNIKELHWGLERDMPPYICGKIWSIQGLTIDDLSTDVLPEARLVLSSIERGQYIHPKRSGEIVLEDTLKADTFCYVADWVSHDTEEAKAVWMTKHGKYLTVKQEGTEWVLDQTEDVDDPNTQFTVTPGMQANSYLIQSDRGGYLFVAEDGRVLIGMDVLPRDIPEAYHFGLAYDSYHLDQQDFNWGNEGQVFSGRVIDTAIAATAAGNCLGLRIRGDNNHLCYKTGKLDFVTKEITWSAVEDFETSKNYRQVEVAMDQQGRTIMVAATQGDELFFKLGKMDSDGNFVWNSDKIKWSKKSHDISLTLDECGRMVVFRVGDNGLRYRVAQINEAWDDILWTNSEQEWDGNYEYASAALDHTGHLFLVCRKDNQFGLCSTAVDFVKGKLYSDSFKALPKHDDWNNSKGLAIALNHRGQLVLANHTTETDVPLIHLAIGEIEHNSVSWKYPSFYQRSYGDSMDMVLLPKKAPYGILMAYHNNNERVNYLVSG